LKTAFGAVWWSSPGSYRIQILGKCGIYISNFSGLENHHRPGKVLENCDADLENSDVNYAEQYISV